MTEEFVVGLVALELEVTVSAATEWTAKRASARYWSDATNAK